MQGQGGSSYHYDRIRSFNDAVNMWYDEIKDYNFETGRGRGTGHFTQVVWKDSTRVGCGVKLRCGGGMMAMTSVVCRYQSPGNYNNNYLSQVGKLVSSGACSREEQVRTLDNSTTLNASAPGRVVQVVYNIPHDTNTTVSATAARGTNALLPPGSGDASA